MKYVIIIFTLFCSSLYSDEFEDYVRKQIEDLRQVTLDLQDDIKTHLDVYQVFLIVGKKNEAEHLLEIYLKTRDRIR